MKTQPRFIVMSASTTPASSCNYPYCRFAVVQLEPGFEGLPKMISDHARGVKRLVATWENCSCGGRYSAQGIARAEATDLAGDLNGEWGKAAQAEARRLYRIKS